MTRAEKLAEARRLVNRCDRTNLTDALRLALDLIEADAPYAGCEHACWTDGKCRSCGRRAEDVAGDLRVARSMLEEKPAPAFDVEALVAGCKQDSDGYIRVDELRAVAREMLKGGGR